MSMKYVILIFISLLSFPSRVRAQPEVSFSELSHDFSVIGQQDKVDHVFTITNSGDRDLVIKKVSAS
jgi:hypothetical protein